MIIFVVQKPLKMAKQTATKNKVMSGSGNVTAPGQATISATVGGKAVEIEELPHPKAPDLPAVLTVDQRAKNQVARFDIAREVIAAKKEEFKDLKIEGPDDKAGEKKVTEAWQWFRNKRLAVTKKKDEIKADYLVITRAVDQEHNELKDLLAEGEKQHGDELDRIAKVREDAKLEAYRKAQAKLQQRVADLLENGMSFTGNYYTIGETISMDVVTLKDMPDDQFTALLGKVQAENKKILDAQAETARLKKEADDAIEAQRLKNIEDKQALDKKNAELQEKLDKLKAATRKVRGQQLEAIGLTFNDDDFQFEYVTADHGTVIVEGAKVDDSEDEDFEALLGFIENQVTDAKALQTATDAKKVKDEQEKKEKKIRTDLRYMELSGLGMKFVHGLGYDRASKYPLLKTGICVKNKDIEELDAADWKFLVEETIGRLAVLSDVELTEDERIKKEVEDERLAGLSDKELLAEFNVKYKELIDTLPKGKAKKMATFLSTTRRRLTEISTDIDTIVKG